jgi:hypothetical protein
VGPSQSDPEVRLAELGIEVPAPFPAFGTFVSAVRNGDTIYTAGHVPFDGSSLVCGKLGDQLDTD